MSFFKSIHQLVSDAGNSINASTRKLASSISQDQDSSEPNTPVVNTPNIEVGSISPISSSGNGQAGTPAAGANKKPDFTLGLNGARKRPTGPLLLPSPQSSTNVPLSPSITFKRRPSLNTAALPGAGGGGGFEPKKLLEPTKSSINLNLGSPWSPAGTPVRNNSLRGSTKRQSFRESFRKKRKNSQELGDKSNRRQSIVQITLNKQAPELDTVHYLKYVEMPNNWAEISDTQKEVSQVDYEFLEFYGSLQLCHESKKRHYFDEWKSIDAQPPLQSSLGIEPVIPQVDKDEKETLYKEVLYTITHKLGTTSSASTQAANQLTNQLIQLQQRNPNAISAALAPLWQSVAAQSNTEKKTQQLGKEELYEYAQEAFQVDKDTHDRLLEEVHVEKPPIVILNVSVVEAENLEAKDPNGYSDPFCMLGIRPGGCSGSPHVKSPREKSPCARQHRGSFDWNAISEASSAAILGFGGITPPMIKAPDLAGEPLSEESVDSVGALPDNLPKPVEKLSRKAGSFRLSFRRRESKKVPKIVNSPAPNLQIPNGPNSNISEIGNTLTVDGLATPGPCPPAKFIRATSVKTKTLNPVWHERFRFDCDDSNTDFLHLDIWDHDDEASVMDAVKKLNEVKDMKGLGRYFKQVARSARSEDGDQNDFLGSIDIPVQNLPAAGSDKWYKLEGRSTGSNIKGSVHLKLWLSSRENRGLNEEEDMWNEIWQHQHIYSLFLSHQLLTLESPHEWNGELSKPASAILQQHAIQGDLTELQIVALRWRALAQQVKDGKNPVHFKVLYEALKDLDKEWDRDLLSNEEERALGEAMCYFVEYGLLLVQHHRKLFTPRNKVAFEKLDYLLRCFQLMSEIKLAAVCFPQAKHLNEEVANALRKGISNGFMEKLEIDSLEELLERREPLNGKEFRSVLHKTSRLLIDANGHLEGGSRHYHSLFEKVLGVNFITTIYKQYDKLIAEELCPILVRICERDLSLESSDMVLPPLQKNHNKKNNNTSGESSGQEASDKENDDEHLGRQRDDRKCGCKIQEKCRHFLTYDLFEVCLAFREVHAKRKLLIPVERKALLMPNTYHDWFLPSFASWLAVVSEQVPVRVEKAVECEKLVTSILHPDLKHSTSCRDVTSCFYHIKDLWNQMGWQNVPNNRSLLAASVDIICKNASLYTSIILKKHAELDMYSGEKGFQISEEFCIGMNDVEHVCQCVMTLPHEFCFSEERSSTSSNSSFEVSDSNEHLLDFVVTTVDQIDFSLYNAFESMTNRIEPAMKKHIFHLAWSPESLPTVDAISPLLGFLNTRLQDFNGRLLKGNVLRCLHIMWEAVLHQIEDHVQSNSSERVPAFYDRLYEALHLLVDYFSINGEGLTGSKLYTENYNRMKLLYGLNKMSTPELIDLYYKERLDDQQSLMHQYHTIGEVPPYGTLCVRVYFRNNCLFVEVIRARNVIPLDSNGLSDPFVVVELLPRRVFQCAEQQTHVQKATLNPKFDECFEFPAQYDQLMESDAMILFSVFDHDVLSRNDFGGEAFFPVRDTPGIQKTKQGSFHGLKPMELPLMFQENADHPILQVLFERNDDKPAQDFSKKQKERVSN